MSAPSSTRPRSARAAPSDNGITDDADGFDFGEGADEAALFCAIAAGNGSHVAATRLAGLMVREGAGEASIIDRPTGGVPQPGRSIAVMPAGTRPYGTSPGWSGPSSPRTRRSRLTLP